MTNYTAQQVEDALTAAFEATDTSWDEADYAWYTDCHGEDGRPLLDIEGVKVYAEYIDGKAPAEGGGEEVFVVFKVGTQFFRKDGFYASHYGTDWDGELYEVRPVEKMVTVYETV